MLPGMIKESKAAISTPGGKQPASAGAAASNSTGNEGRRKQRQEATDSEDESDDDDADDDEEDESEFEPEEEAGEDDREEAGGGGGSRSVQQTQRPRARKSAAAQQQRGEAAANGKAPVPNMFDRSSAPSGNRHGLGGQASAASAAAGRANPFANSGIGGRGQGDFCKKPCGDGDKCQCAAGAVEQCTGDATCAQNLVAFKDGAVVANACLCFSRCRIVWYRFGGSRANAHEVTHIRLPRSRFVPLIPLVWVVSFCLVPVCSCRAAPMMIC